MAWNVLQVEISDSPALHAMFRLHLEGCWLWGSSAPMVWLVSPRTHMMLKADLRVDQFGLDEKILHVPVVVDDTIPEHVVRLRCDYKNEPIGLFPVRK